MNNIVIFGAEGYALGICKAIKTVYPDKHILCFLVFKVGYTSQLLFMAFPYT